ncbi:hypothetical protein BV20DRAFT_373066 [Pilatotrama ljubarskyi]|nr:hypothetical protein BV20DRAFT_373066 [Pilatotrama ljubarskyi]
MSWLYDYRVFSYVISLGCEVAIFVQSTDTLNVADQVHGLSLTYARFALATSVITAIPLALVLIRECMNRPVDIRTELLSLPVFAAFWLSVGGAALKARHANFDYQSCDDITNAALNTVCIYANPISTFSFIPAGIMLAYGMILLLVAVCSQRSGKPVWANAVRSPEMAQLATGI